MFGPGSCATRPEKCPEEQKNEERGREKTGGPGKRRMPGIRHHPQDHEDQPLPDQQEAELACENPRHVPQRSILRNGAQFHVQGAVRGWGQGQEDRPCEPARAARTALVPASAAQSRDLDGVDGSAPRRMTLGASFSCPGRRCGATGSRRKHRPCPTGLVCNFPTLSRSRSARWFLKRAGFQRRSAWRNLVKIRNGPFTTWVRHDRLSYKLYVQALEDF